MSSLQAVTCNVSVLMPTFQQAAFIGRAITSLLLQTLQDWELLIVDDGTEGDDTWRAVQPWRCDHRIRCRRLPHHRGLGAALNEAMAAAQGSRIAYLPSDDIYYRDHLASLAALLESAAAAIMARSGLLHPYKQRANGDDLNDPARIGTFAVAGIPMIQRVNRAAVAASQALVGALDTSFCFTRTPATWPRSCGNRCGKSACCSALTTTSAASWPFSAKRCVIGANAGCKQPCMKATSMCRPCNSIHHKENKTCSII